MQMWLMERKSGDPQLDFKRNETRLELELKAFIILGEFNLTSWGSCIVCDLIFTFDKWRWINFFEKLPELKLGVIPPFIPILLLIFSDDAYPLSFALGDFLMSWKKLVELFVKYSK